MSTPTVLTAVHPTPCPPWCKDRTASRHDAGPRITPHFSEQIQLPAPGAGVLARAELVRLDETGERPETVLFVQGESTAELRGPVEVGLYLANLRAHLRGVEVLAAHMQAGA